MGVSCGAQVIKIVLFVFNLLWLILGGVVIWLGVTITSWSGDLDKVLDENMKGGAIAVLVAGALIFLIAFLGCCGACKENSCMLSTYGGIILILVIVQCVGVYFAFKYRSKVEDTVRDGVKREVDNFLDKKSKEAASIVQNIQSTFQCCGYDSYTDYIAKQHWVPASCCDQSFKDDPLNSQCSGLGQLAPKYTEGCGQKLKDTLTKYLGGMAGVAIALILVQLIIILMACCLSREVRN